MKITREEFKEYVGLYQEAWNKFETYADIIDSDLLDGLMFPLFTWLDEKFGLRDDNIGSYILEYITCSDEPVDWYSLYDEWLGGNYDVQ